MNVTQPYKTNLYCTGVENLSYILSEKMTFAWIIIMKKNIFSSVMQRCCYCFRFRDSTCLLIFLNYMLWFCGWSWQQKSSLWEKDGGLFFFFLWSSALRLTSCMLCCSERCFVLILICCIRTGEVRVLSCYFTTLQYM